MITEDDDDTHICLKCHTTITGLDNYVAHRKSSCGSQATVHSKSRTPSPLIAPDVPDFTLKADDFFSLLELQSSSKKSTLQVPSTSKNNSGVLTRSKATAAIQASNLNKDTSYCLADKRATDWIGGHHLRELGNEDNQTKLINAVDNISGNIKKDEPTRINYEVLEEDSNEEYEDEEEEFEEVECPGAPPRSHTGGKWSSSPIQWLRPSSSHSHEEGNEWENPPPSHTGGKWKPTPPPSHNQGYRSDEDVPPPSHTKGKWIPVRAGSDLEPGRSIQVDIIPPLRKSSGTVQYWCGPCNRRLASKIVYERHLKSELHYKRTMHEREFDDPSGYLNVKKTSRKRSERKGTLKKPHLWLESESDDKKKILENETKKRRIRTQSSVRCEVCRSKVLTHLMGKHLISHYHCRKRDVSKPVAQQMVLDNIHGVVQQAPFQCAVCRFFCNKESDFLFHWRSVEHNATVEKTDGFFLCSFCKFESAHNDTMEEHLLSENHSEVISVINRSVPIVIRKIVPVSCDTCGKHFRYNIELRRHCNRENHSISGTGTDKYQEKHRCGDCNLIFKSNKSMQHHLQHRHGKNYFFCSSCSMSFDSYQAAKLHRRSQQHKYTVLTINNEKTFQAKDISKVCKYCLLRFPNVLYLKTHLRDEHPEHSHSCTQCGQKFTLSQEVTHHIRNKACRFDSSSDAYYSCEKCPYKTDSQADYLFHDTLHTEPISPEFSKLKKFLQYKCPVCSKYFKKTSLRCHIRLHCNERPFQCKLCKNAYARKSNLMDHIRMHEQDLTNQPYKETMEISTCSICGYSCERKEQLLRHVKLEHNEDLNEEKQEKKNASQFFNSEKKFLCSFCGKSFLKKYTLQQHMKLHTGKTIQCPLAGCLFTARSNSDLKPHLATHSEQQPFGCQHCDYRSKTKQQLRRHVTVHDVESSKKYLCPHCPFHARLASHLKRHLRLHTGAKPYLCPHCDYACNNLENLRKHVLSTNRHPGKCIYECKFCEEPDEYATNFAKEFRVHLLTHHGDRFESPKVAAGYVLGIYNAEEDPKNVQEPLNISQKGSSPKPKSSELVLSSLPSTSTSRSTILLTAAAEEAACVPVDSELIVVSNPTTDIIYVELPSAGTEPWTMEGYYDVEESGTLVPFQQFEEHDN